MLSLTYQDLKLNKNTENECGYFTLLLGNYLITQNYVNIVENLTNRDSLTITYAHKSVFFNK